MAHTPGPEGASTDMTIDEQAARIRELIVDCCVASEPIGALLQVRADLLALAEATSDPEAMDAACGAVAEIDAALDARAAAARRQAS